MKNILALPEKEFTLFQKLLIEESGLYFNKDRTNSLQLALWKQVQERQYSSYQEYYNLLKFHPEGRRELRKLLDRITIGETYFFRNHPQFDALKEYVLPDIIRRKHSSLSLRIWSAGCSRGDEPYSLAIAIMEILPTYEEWDISILGTDINRNSILDAKEAVYVKKDVSHLTEEQINRYFHKSGTKYILDNKVKRLVRFEYHNLAKDPFTLEGMSALDIILCRNVTIYFDTQTTKRIVDNFYNCLSWNSYFFIGHAETLWHISDKFKTVELPHTFIYKKVRSHVKEGLRPLMSVPDIRLEQFERPERRAVKPTKKIRPPEKERRIHTRPDRAKLDNLYKEANRFYNEKRYEEALALFDDITTQDKGFIGAYLAKATILANQANYKDAIVQLHRIITVDNLYVEAYYLLGVLSCKTRNFDEAETQFRKVIYINPDIVLEYFNLGNIYLYRKRWDSAVREFKNAARLLEDMDKEAAVMFSEDFTVDFLLRACKNSIEEINRKV
ncbi:MAG: CheR family methyltransferase [Thermodesulfobacteriota bacterium]